MKTVFLWIAATALLAGCGVKPSDVEPPAGAKKSEFPRTYPKG